MILQALNDYYLRKKKKSENEVAKEGFAYQEIPFLIRLDSKGKFLSIYDTRKKEGKRLTGQKFLVPAPVTRSSGVNPNLLWDKTEYSLGIPNPLKITELDKNFQKDPVKYTAEKVEQERKKLEYKTHKRFESFINIYKMCLCK